MGKQFGGNQGLKKRQRGPMKFCGGKGRQASKKGRTDEVVPTASSSSQEELSEEYIPLPAVYREPSMYDNLLTKLGSSSKSLADEFKRRQRREEGNSDTEEEEEEKEEEDSDGSESIGESEEEDERKLEDYITVGDAELVEDAGSEDESEACSIDIDHDSEANAQTADELPTCSSSFDVHLGHTLSKAEAENLLKKKWKYEWEEPAVNMPNCKWVGTGECFLNDITIDSDHGLKLKLYKPWLDVFKKSGGNDSEQRLFFSLCDSYKDILHCNKKPFYLKGREEDSSIMDAYIMHSLNHVFRTRDLVMTNKTKLNRQENAEKLIAGDEFLDQGFTRPKVLILLPFKSIAKRVIERLIQLTRPAHQGNVDNKDRFNKEYGVEDDGLTGVQNGDLGNSKFHKPSKPSDFQALFSGNTDDHFMIGIKFTRKSIKLYNDFYKADMIIASPLNLITKIGHSEVDKEKDVDYLSSIEVLVIDHADVIAMQNWDHVKTVVQQLNQIPSKQHGTDIMRIRPWYLDGHARFYRQTIVLGSYLNPDMNALFNHHCTSYRGKVKSVCQYKGVLPKVLLQVRQIYERFNPESIVDEDDARFEYFTTKVFPKIKDSLQGGVMIFASSYFEYVRIRNFLKSQNASFCLLGEYTKQKDISRARVWFFEGTRKIMLYTERAHFYHRYKIRGIQNLIIYSLPERKEIYPEIVNMLEGSHNMSSTVLFSRFDQLRLERIVGTSPAKRMVTSEKAVFVFC